MGNQRIYYAAGDYEGACQKNARGAGRGGLMLETGNLMLVAQASPGRRVSSFKFQAKIVGFYQAVLTWG